MKPERADARTSALTTPRDAAVQLRISVPTIKQWIYRGKIRSIRTPGGHHRIPASAFTSRRAAAERGDLRLVPARPH